MSKTQSNVDDLPHMSDAIADMLVQGLIERHGDGYKLTEKGRQFGTNHRVEAEHMLRCMMWESICDYLEQDTGDLNVIFHALIGCILATITAKVVESDQGKSVLAVCGMLQERWAESVPDDDEAAAGGY